MKSPFTPSHLHENTLMYAEAIHASVAVRTQIDTTRDQFAQIGSYLRKAPPNFALTIGRGSSDHAGVYARYLLESQLGVVTSPAALSINSVYGAKLNVQNSLSLAFSQSGKSPDIVASVKAMRENGSYTVSFVNVDNSPLAKHSDISLPLCAGPEKSVAATKSFITSMVAGLQLVAHWKNDQELLDAIETLPALLNDAQKLDWTAAMSTFTKAKSVFVLGRGVGFGLAREAALKFKETCCLHAEAYSAAEVLHGPAALVKKDYPILAFCQDDETKNGMATTLETLHTNGAQVYVAGLSSPKFNTLPTIDAHPLLQPILMAQSFYIMVNAVSQLRGYNPDTPPHLSKVTQTL